MSDSLETALAFHRNGQLALAERGYRDLLAQEPQHALALHLLGVLALQSGQPGTAVELITRAIAIDATDPMAYLNLGGALKQLGRREEALASLERALELAPDYADAWNNRGDLLIELKRPADALEALNRALQLQPDFMLALNNRGNALRDLGRAAEALDCYERALILQPDFARALNNRGNALRDLGCLEAALASFDQALRIQSDYQVALCNRGSVLLELRRYAEALAVFDQLLQRQPGDAVALSGRATALLNLGRLHDAHDSSARAIELGGDLANVQNNRGSLLLQLHQFESALIHIERALQLEPLHADALNNRGTCLMLLMRYGEARQSFEKLLQAAPSYPYARGRLLYAQLCGCEWLYLERRIEALLRDIDNDPRLSEPSRLLALPSTAEQQWRCARAYTETHHPASQSVAPRSGSERRPGPIRLAYLSGDFREHAVSTSIVGVLEHHDRQRFEITGIALLSPDSSALDGRMTAAVDRLIDVSQMSDEEVARWISTQEIDIAVDLTGFTYGTRPGILSRRPAAVQVNYLGYPGTLGAPYIDYLIGDATVVPEDSKRWYSEQVVRLPGFYLPHDDRRTLSAQALSRGQYGLPDSGFVFGSFANSYKITPSIFDIWMRLLRTVPGSVLWLRADSPEIQNNLREAAANRRVSPDRLIFASRVSDSSEHLARHQLIDLMLDTAPYNGHSTACDALWAGVPLLTCTGQAFASRVGASALMSIGLSELVTHSLASYERRALELANAPAELAAVRERLARLRTQSALFNTGRYTRQLEAAYMQMQERAGRGLAPQSFDVPSLESA